ncbi:amino acid permease [Merismopedia glauca]|uniref:Amino acid ABC transporter permease n=1 Tax=Merismopedia glauca CCAP 1448/3 TaxID=1296344 RepID=A0A2T1CAH9_9CYAN|nr:amino acid permease [Merismopedia glauca]PSB05251.1 amino acid ABC transporter permease [Merismopedia glauca CCAP 1448/3]
MLRANNLGLVSYEKVHESYLRQRKLKGNANGWLLWSLGVGAVIGGEFFGWNFGLDKGGVVGLGIATILMAIMYVCLVYSISEMSASFPHAGGFYSYTRQAFGPFWAFICGMALIIEYVLTVATTVISISDYMQPVLPQVPPWVIWIAAYAIFVSINIWGMSQTIQLSLYLCLSAILVLVIFFVTALTTGLFQTELLFNIPPTPGNTHWLPFGWEGAFRAIPYAIWFYLAIEQVPLAAEETENPAKNIPQGLISGIFTLIILSFLVLILNSGVGGGAMAVSKSTIPLGYGLEIYYNTGYLINIAVLCGVISTFHSITFAYARSLFAMSRAGYIPRWISVTSKTYTPYRALLLGAGVGLACAALIKIFSDAAVGSILLNMSVFGAVISYILVMLSYLKLKMTRPELLKNYHSPLGVFGGFVGLILAVVAFIACFSEPSYRPGLIGIAVVMGLSIFYFLAFSRHEIVAKAPEEKAALLASSISKANLG